MTSRSKGAGWELDLVHLLRERGWANAERSMAGNSQLAGDIQAIPGWTLEAKYRKHPASSCAAEPRCAVLQLTSWLAQARKNARSWRYAVLVKRPGKSDPAEGYAVLTVDSLLRLLLEAGY